MNTNETTKPADPQQREREWLEAHRDDFVSEIRGAGLDTHCLYDLPKLLAAYRAHVIEEAIAKLQLEKVAAEETGEESDYAYNRAVDDCIAVLRDMKEH